MYVLIHRTGSHLSSGSPRQDIPLEAKYDKGIHDEVYLKEFPRAYFPTQLFATQARIAFPKGQKPRATPLSQEKYDRLV